MARAKPTPTLDVTISDLITTEEVANLSRLQDIRERARHHRAIVLAWRRQQDQDRRMRRVYANWLIGAMTVQIIAIHILFVLMGLGTLNVETTMASTFIVATFAEISALVLLVVKYLFPPTTDRLLDLIDRFRESRVDAR